MSNEDVFTKKQEAWAAQGSEMNELCKIGAEEFFKKEFPDIKLAFLSDLRAVVCMDEGTAHKDLGGLGKFCVAGSGILLPAANEEERIKKAAELFKKIGIQNVSSHGGCGAAGIAYKRDFPEKHVNSITPNEIEEYAKNWSKKVSEEMVRMGADAEYTHILSDEMERPVEFHTARVVYYDCVGGFNPNIEIGMPMGFVIERANLEKDYALQELGVAISIAFGHHGFGELFDSENPFVLIALAKNADDLEKFKTEITESIKDNQYYLDKKVKVDGAVI
jgi:hypothetical protein